MSWVRQDSTKPLFPDLLWSKPENKRSAGKLLIIGGQAGEFINVSSAYSFALEAGAGTVRILLPDSLKKLAGDIKGVEFAPSNKSGSFSKSALANMFDLAEWADHLLLAGDFGKNSETTIILDGFLLRGIKPVTISEHTLSSIGISLEQLINKPVGLVVSRTTFQKIGVSIRTHVPITSLTTFESMAEIAQNISTKMKASIAVVDENHIWCAFHGDVVSTQTKPVDINALSAYCSVWLMQNQFKPLEALTAAVYEVKT